MRVTAVKTAHPCLTSVIAICSSVIYNDGVVVYKIEQSIRILHLEGCVTNEMAIKIPRLLKAANLKYLELGALKLLYYACGFTSCLLDIRSAEGI